MKKRILFACYLVIVQLISYGQFARVMPADAGADDEAKIIFDATQGNKELQGASKVYVHSGIVTDGPTGIAWNNVVGNWGADDGVGQMTKVDGKENEWEITLSPTVREYYNAAAETNIFRLAMVFRSADGNTKASINPGTYEWGTVTNSGDTYLNIGNDGYVIINEPDKNEVFVASGELVTISALASGDVTSMKLEIDEGNGFEEKVAVSSGKSISYNYMPANSLKIKVKVTAIVNQVTVTDQKELNIIIRSENESASVPAGMIKGINYVENDPTKVVLVFEAPLKEFVYVVGDFTGWEVDATFQMKKDEGKNWYWLEVTGLEAGKPYVFQYWVEGVIKVGDPYADQVADPWNDQYIPESVFPNIPAYSLTENEIATVLQTNQQPYQWAATEQDWVRPPVEDLIVYELLVRDFVGSHHYKDLTDTLSYLKRLGINAIELLPIMEFEGNESWGYNPSYFFAVDKYYGTKDQLKEFIETAHAQGFAVILDMVLNHAFGQNPWVRMYWDSQNNRPAANSPYFNPVPKHPFNVGYDFNHTSQYTQRLVDSVNRYWIEEYHFDGFRFDLSKGFTQTDYGDDVSAWSQYDVGRINILKSMANKIWAVDPTAYVILEHFSVQQEEDELAAAGMISWRNSHGDFRGALQGNGTNIQSATTMGRIAYMESHDEERQMVDMVNGGKTNEDYSVRNLEAALERSKMGAAFLFMQPGPKMMWQFGELGYDIGINFNGRTGNKPLPWGVGNLGYYEDELRQYVYEANAAVIKLRNDYKQIFRPANTTNSLNTDMKRIVISHEDLNLVLVGNFGIVENTIQTNFPVQGTWYDYFSGEELDAAANASVSLAPGFFRLLTDRKIAEGFPNVIAIYTNPVAVSPAVFNLDNEITITFDATKASKDGTNGLVGADKVYMHAGLVVDDPNGRDLTKIIGNLIDDGVGQMTKVSGTADKWEIKLTPREYFGLGGEDKAFRIGVYFRDANNTNVGKGFRNRPVYLDIQPDGSIVTINPPRFFSNESITLTYDASFGDRNLLGSSKIYMHSGIVTGNTATPGSGDWKNVVGNWGVDDGVGLMTKVEGTDQWQITITPANYYSKAANDSIYWLAMVFRNATGSEKGSGSPGNFNGGIINPSGDIFMKVLPPEAIPEPLSVEPQNKFVVYPNPSGGIFYLQGVEPEQEVTMVITDMSGKMILKSTQKAGQSLDARQVSPGIYLLRIQSRDFYIERKVIID